MSPELSSSQQEVAAAQGIVKQNPRKWTDPEEPAERRKQHKVQEPGVGGEGGIRREPTR